MKLLHSSIFIIFSSCSCFDKSYVASNQGNILFLDKLSEQLINEVERVVHLTCFLKPPPKSQQELLFRCHNQFRDAANQNKANIVVVDPRLIGSVKGGAPIMIDIIGNAVEDRPKNVYMYGTLYRYK